MVLQKILDFWKRYENLSLKVTFVLISLQLVHLFWLSTDVVLTRIFGDAFTLFPSYLLPIQAVIDYLEIPALVAGITYYSLSLYKRVHAKNLIFIILLGLQFLHLFWITDEIVYKIFFGAQLVVLPFLLAWTAIGIDYLEIPVMVDLFRRLYRGKKD